MKRCPFLFGLLFQGIFLTASQAQTPTPPPGVTATPLPSYPFGTYILGSNPGALSIGPEGMYIYGTQPGTPPVTVPYGSLEAPGVYGIPMATPASPTAAPPPVAPEIPLQQIPIQVTCQCECPYPPVPTPIPGEREPSREEEEAQPTPTETPPGQ